MQHVIKKNARGPTPFAKMNSNSDNAAFEARLLAAARRQGYDEISRFDVPARLRNRAFDKKRFAMVIGAVFNVAAARPKTFFYSDNPDFVKLIIDAHALEHSNTAYARPVLYVQLDPRGFNVIERELVMTHAFPLADKDCCVCLEPIMKKDSFSLSATHSECASCYAAMHRKCLDGYVRSALGFNLNFAGAVMISDNRMENGGGEKKFAIETCSDGEHKGLRLEYPCPVCRQPQVNVWESKKRTENGT